MLCRYPGCTDRAVLMGAPVVPYRKLGPQISRAFLTFMGNHPRCQPLGKRLLATRLYGHLVARFLNMYRYDRALVDRCGLTGRRAIKPRTLFEMGKSVTNYDLVGSLGRLTVPTRLIYGHQDGIVDHQKISELVQKNPALSLAYVENAGHVVSLEKPAETARILWLQDQS